MKKKKLVVGSVFGVLMGLLMVLGVGCAWKQAGTQAEKPTVAPTRKPTAVLTMSPTSEPTAVPTEGPTAAPTEEPDVTLTPTPTEPAMSEEERQAADEALIESLRQAVELACAVDMSQFTPDENGEIPGSSEFGDTDVVLYWWRSGESRLHQPMQDGFEEPIGEDWQLSMALAEALGTERFVLTSDRYRDTTIAMEVWYVYGSQTTVKTMLDWMPEWMLSESE